ncbi:MAG: cysteine hydrolase, partial [Tissierellia bacterium]|nr:cysteine hydrolase [Tissierellia bacterium]
MGINNLHKVKKEDCVLMIIDMQYDFLAENAPVKNPGGMDIV